LYLHLEIHHQKTFAPVQEYVPGKVIQRGVFGALNLLLTTLRFRDTFPLFLHPSFLFFSYTFLLLFSHASFRFLSDLALPLFLIPPLLCFPSLTFLLFSCSTLLFLSLLRLTLLFLTL
jgi:hypothetical protein